MQVRGGPHHAACAHVLPGREGGGDPSPNRCLCCLLQVALLDKEKFPRDKICGDAVCTPAIRWAVWGRGGVGAVGRGQVGRAKQKAVGSLWRGKDCCFRPRALMYHQSSTLHVWMCEARILEVGVIPGAGETCRGRRTNRFMRSTESWRDA